MHDVTLAMRCAALALAVLAGCGGGEGQAADPATARSGSGPLAAPADVALEGCVDDARHAPAAGVAVHARSADGRLLVTGVSDATGVFIVRVPAGGSVVVALEGDGATGLDLRVGTGALSVAACLRAA